MAELAAFATRMQAEVLSDPVLQEAFVLLEGLRLGVEWELHPAIKAKIADVAPRLQALLTRARAEETSR